MTYVAPRSGASAERPPLFPPAVAAFAHRRAQEAAGGTLILSGLLLSVALLTYDPADPSLNTATSLTVASNWLGMNGAWLADLLVQSIGLASFVPVIMLASWGARLALKQPLPRIGWRLFFTGVATILTAGALAGLPEWGTWPFGLLSGGGLGAVVLADVTAILPGAWEKFSAFWPAALCAIVASVMLLPAMGFSYLQWGNGALHLSRWGRLLARYIAVAVLALYARFQKVDEDDEKPRRKSRRLLIDKDIDEPEEAEVEEEVEEEAEEETDELPLEGGEAVPPPRRRLQLPKRRKAVETNYGRYEFPPLELLAPPEKGGPRQSQQQLDETAEQLTSVLGDFGVEGNILKASPGPVVTLYELEPAPGTKSARVIGLSDDIARQMSAISVRVATVPGRNVLGIELPNRKRETVYLRELLQNQAYAKSTAKLPLSLGKDIGGEPIVADLARMPHLLVAGTTGSGKSVAINTMILSLLYKLTPEQVRFIMVDPKMLELSIYEGIPHLLAPVVTEPKKAVVALKWTVREMEDRYRLMAKLGVRNIDGYNERVKEARAKGEVLTRRVQTGFDGDTGKPVFEEQPIDLIELPFIVVVVDEMADLMLVAGKDIEAAIQRLAQMARAAGIHLIMATQRPSVDVITGTIKANFPTRISFQVTSKIDSRTILGEQGAEQLLGQGDMLYMAGGGRITRVHGPFASDHEVESIVRHLKAQGEPVYLEAVTKDEEEGFSIGAGGGDGEGSGDALYDQAVQVVLRERKASTSYIQRVLQIGYNRAARLIERMEAEGLVGPANHVGKREILVPGESAR